MRREPSNFISVKYPPSIQEAKPMKNLNQLDRTTDISILDEITETTSKLKTEDKTPEMVESSCRCQATQRKEFYYIFVSYMEIVSSFVQLVYDLRTWSQRPMP